jgi:hypothetical protein
MQCPLSFRQSFDTKPSVLIRIPSPVNASFPSPKQVKIQTPLKNRNTKNHVLPKNLTAASPATLHSTTAR